MGYYYRYWAWVADIGCDPVDLMQDLASWGCTVEYGSDRINIWIPEKENILLVLKYPEFKRYPIFDRY